MSMASLSTFAGGIGQEDDGSPALAHALLAARPQAAPDLVVGFDDVDGVGRYSKVPDGYNGFTWHHAGVADAAREPPGSGYVTGATSGHHTGFTESALPLSIKLPHGTFTLHSVNLTAAWDTSLTVDIYGYRGGEAIYHRTVQIGDAGPTAVDLDFSGIGRVMFVPGHGVDDPNLDGVGDHIVLDDLVFRDIHIRGTANAAPHQFVAGSAAFHHEAIAAGLHVIA